MSRSEDNPSEANEAGRPIIVDSQGNAGSSETAAPKKAKQPKTSEYAGTHMSESKNLPQNQPAPVIIKQSGGRGLAVGALVLALLGLGASGFLFVQGQNVLKNQELSFNQKLDKAALGESENALLLKDHLNRQTAIQAELERLGKAQMANSEQILLTQKAYQELTKGRVNWLVDEAETMLNLASQQLLLSGNVQGAAAVLEHIDGRLSRFDQPELLPIKQAVSHDLAALKNRPYVDISGTALRLDRLETAVSGLPLVLDGVLQPGEQAQSNGASSGSWWQNTWDKSLVALKGLVEVRRLDNKDAMLLSPEQAYFVRENLRLRLLDARTALMQHNGEVYQSDLNYVEAAVKQYFDGKSPATQAWLKELSELKALDVRMISDDSLKASLSAIRAYQDGTRTPVALPEPVTTAASAPLPSAASEAAAPQAASQVNETTSAPKTAPAPRAAHPAKARPSPAQKSAPAAQTDAKPLEAPALPSEAKPQNISEPEKKAAPEKQSRPAADAETKGGRA